MYKPVYIEDFEIKEYSENEFGIWYQGNERHVAASKEDALLIADLMSRIENMRTALHAIADKKEIAFCIANDMKPFPKKYEKRVRMVAQNTWSYDSLFHDFG